MKESIYILCKEKEKNSKIKSWSKTIKLHLQNSKIGGINLFKGIGPFILKLDGKPTLGKTYKSWDMVAHDSLLSIKIDNPNYLG